MGTASAIVRWRCTHYDGIVALAACEHFERGPGMNSMMAVLLSAGIGFLLAGLLAIGFGVPVKEFSFGNTLMLMGAVSACTGVILFGLWIVARQLRDIAQRLGPDFPSESHAGAASGAPRSQAPENGGFLFSRDQPVSEDEDMQPTSSAPWHEEAASRDRGRNDAPEPVEAASAVKPRRNLLFSTSSRKERERAQARTAGPSAAELRPPPAAAPPPSPESSEPPATFDDAWPKSDRARAADALPPRRGGRAPSTFAEASGAGGADRSPPAVRNEDPSPVTVLKSGVVDGMAYSLYSDGSIEAQMPEGMMRFASIDELRAHLDQRP
jgi:hypothetical protein